jgi:hypothetical protein
MGVKGGCSPQNNLPKSAELLNELKHRRNKNFYNSDFFLRRNRKTTRPATGCEILNFGELPITCGNFGSGF